MYEILTRSPPFFYKILDSDILKYLLSVVGEINFVPDFRRLVLDSLNFHLPMESESVKVTSHEIQTSAFPDRLKVAKLKCYHFPSGGLYYGNNHFGNIPHRLCEHEIKLQVCKVCKEAFDILRSCVFSCLLIILHFTIIPL